MISAITVVSLALIVLVWIWIDSFRAKRHAHR